MSGLPRRGVFIAFEGGEGTGKSTQGRLLAEALRARGIGVITTREPGGTPGAEAIRRLLLDPPGETGWTSEAEALLFAASRADHVAHLIRPALERGDWVICDRFVDSSRAYQGGAGGLGDAAILALHAFGSAGLRPDLVILLEADEATLAARLAARDGDASDAIGGRPVEYHRAVAAAFRDLATRDPQGFARIDAVGDPQTVHARVLAALEPLLASRVV
ncbi:dTMP kinase [Porphyrobacter sp. LM 6]|uniref:dTMP kinase n=1 Tax=Porphyrobacter sp. LM 6 TaxID=1896196 RepID=UPI000863B575|nr:dTMP kinase [Porphyrobacter sp. LM 6]AOL94870.1 thymidylate kinase [Porphyrobacter sp. LM 6]